MKDVMTKVILGLVLLWPGLGNADDKEEVRWPEQSKKYLEKYIQDKIKTEYHTYRTLESGQTLTSKDFFPDYASEEINWYFRSPASGWKEAVLIHRSGKVVRVTKSDNCRGTERLQEIDGFPANIKNKDDALKIAKDYLVLMRHYEELERTCGKEKLEKPDISKKDEVVQDCNRCRGSGEIEGKILNTSMEPSEYEIEQCPDCKGAGEIRSQDSEGKVKATWVVTFGRARAESGPNLVRLFVDSEGRLLRAAGKVASSARRQ